MISLLFLHSVRFFKASLLPCTWRGHSWGHPEEGEGKLYSLSTQRTSDKWSYQCSCICWLLSLLSTFSWRVWPWCQPGFASSTGTGLSAPPKPHLRTRESPSSSPWSGRSPPCAPILRLSSRSIIPNTNSSSASTPRMTPPCLVLRKIKMAMRLRVRRRSLLLPFESAHAHLPFQPARAGFALGGRDKHKTENPSCFPSGCSE